MSSQDSPYPSGQQWPGGQDGYQQDGGYQPPQYQQDGGYQYQQYQQGQQDQYSQGSYQQPQDARPQYQQPSGPYGQYPQAGPYQQSAPYGAMPRGPYPPGGSSGAPGPDGYLTGGSVGFTDAIKLAFRCAFVYRGRASRSAYWWFALFSIAASLIVDGVLSAAGGSSGAVSAIALLVSLALFVAGLPLAVRRLHDIDRTGWWLLIGLIPLVGSITLFVFSVLEGTRGPNRFG